MLSPLSRVIRYFRVVSDSDIFTGVQLTVVIEPKKTSVFLKTTFYFTRPRFHFKQKTSLVTSSPSYDGIGMSDPPSTDKC